MGEKYPVMLGGQAVGAAQVERQGLYYHFHCQCRFSGEVIYCVTVACGDKQINLGVCVPQDGSFALKTRVAIKRLGDGELSFRAVPRRGETMENFFPVYPEEPFSYIDKLQKAFLQVRNGQIGVVINEPDNVYHRDSGKEISKPTGQ